MNSLDVWLTFPDGERVKAGDIAYDKRQKANDPGSAFRYSINYLSHPKAFALDPKSLPLSNEEYVCERAPEDIHSVFEDSLPDAWGRRLLTKKYNLRARNNELVNLLPYILPNGIGALSYNVPDNKPADTKMQNAHIQDLESLVHAAESFERGEEIDKEYQLLFSAGSSPGGARPKALVTEKEQEKETFWLAKFSSIKDNFSMITLESASLALAREAGLVVPDCKVVNLNQSMTLLVKRFDVTAIGGRAHLISLKTLVGDQYYLRYQDLMDAIRIYSDQPQIDIPAFFRQLCYNVLIGNTDDHAKNFSMLHTEDGWSLSPAYDLLPNVGENPEHALQFTHTAYPPTRDELFSIGHDMFRLSSRKVINIFEEVYEPLTQWKSVFETHRVPDDDIIRLGKDINRRLSRKKRA